MTAPAPPPGPLDADPPPGAEEPSGKARDAAMILPFVGLALFSPPIVMFFGADTSWFGAPAIVVYLFSAWLCLIGAAWALSRLLARRLSRRDG